VEDAAPDRSFIEDGFKNWKAALKNGKGFQRREGSTAHHHALTALNIFSSTKSNLTSVDMQIDSHHKAVLTAQQRQIAANRCAVARTFLGPFSSSANYAYRFVALLMNVERRVCS